MPPAPSCNDKPIKSAEFHRSDVKFDGIHKLGISQSKSAGSGKVSYDSVGSKSIRLGCSEGMMNGANSKGELLVDDSGCWSIWLLSISGEGHVAVMLVGSEDDFLLKHVQRRSVGKGCPGLDRLSDERTDKVQQLDDIGEQNETCAERVVECPPITKLNRSSCSSQTEQLACVGSGI
ncbi:hypothetical protein TMatcc_001761 [Talaromyces marneffei ATCC 18224]